MQTVPSEHEKVFNSSTAFSVKNTHLGCSVDWDIEEAYSQAEERKRKKALNS